MTDQVQEAAPATDIITLPPSERAAIALASTKTEIALKAMADEAAAVTAVKDKTDREFAHRVAMKLKNARIDIEKVGKKAREDAQAFSKAVLDEEKRLKQIIAAEEDRVFKLRDEYDAEQRRIEEERVRKEAERIATIRGRIHDISALPAALAGSTSESIMNERNALACFEPTAELFAEFLNEANAAITETVAALDRLYAQVKAREDAEELLAKEREEAATREREAAARAEAAEREAAELREILERERAERAKFAPREQQHVNPESLDFLRPLLPDGFPAGVLDAQTEDAAQSESTEAQQPTISVVYRAATVKQIKAMAEKVALLDSNLAASLLWLADDIQRGERDYLLKDEILPALLNIDRDVRSATEDAISALNHVKAAA